MYNSIIEFIEKDTTKIEKFIKESLLSGNMMRFEEKLRDTVLEFGRSLYQEILESIEQTIRNSEFRKQSYHVEHKEDCVRIPMLGDIRSLNLGNSVAIVLYEALRQNGFAGMNLEGHLHELHW